MVMVIDGDDDDDDEFESRSNMLGLWKHSCVYVVLSLMQLNSVSSCFS